MSENTADENNSGSRQIDTLLARIDELESRATIRDLVSDYCHGIDGADWSLFGSVWHVDGIWEAGLPTGPIEGREKIVEAGKEMSAAVFTESHHLASNVRLDFESPDRALGVCNAECIGVNSQATLVTASVTYNDIFERRGGHWKFARRQVIMNIFTPIEGVKIASP